MKLQRIVTSDIGSFSSRREPHDNRDFADQVTRASEPTGVSDISGVSGCRSWVLGCLSWALLVLTFIAPCGCGGAANADANKKNTRGGLAGVEDTRCQYEGRKDRVAILTKGRGAGNANIRRVYAVGNEKDGRRIIRCREADTNLDGLKDLIRTYNERGEPQSEQADANFDGKMDTWVEFSSGKVIRAEVDHNRDGKPDEFKVYSGGYLARVQRDSNFNGQIDTWEVYEEGRLRRIGTDTDGDQRVDLWYRDEVKRAEAEKAREQESKEAEQANEEPSSTEDANEPAAAPTEEADEPATKPTDETPKPAAKPTKSESPTEEANEPGAKELASAKARESKTAPSAPSNSDGSAVRKTKEDEASKGRVVEKAGAPQ